MNEQFEFKSAASGAISLDEMQGIVECFVAGIGNKDSVGDIVVTGAFAKSLTRRKPRVVWAHSWNDPIGKVLEMYEVPPGDPRLPAKMRNAGIGGLYAKVQFNLQSEKGKEAFASVAFFGEEQEWSIGYKTINGAFDPAQQANVLREVELYEVSPVLHGANQLTGTISVKSEQKNHMMPVIAGMPMMGEQQQPRMIVIAAPEKEQEQDEPFNIFAEGLAQPLDADKTQKIQAELSERTGSQVDIVEATDSFIVFRRTTNDGKVSMYRVGYHTPDGYNTFMFGKPEVYAGNENKPPIQQQIEVKPADASMVPAQPQQMPYRDDDQEEMNTMLGGQVGVGKSAYAHLIEIPQAYLIQAKSMLQPVFNYHNLSTTDADNGIVVNGTISAQAIDALQTAVKAIGQTIGQTVGNLRTLSQSFNPFAIDGDNDGFAQDGTAFQRPYIPIKKPDMELPEVGGKKRNSSDLLDKPTVRTGKKPIKDPNLLSGTERQEALAAGDLQPRTMDDISFLANRRPENEGLAKYWDMSESDLRSEGQKLVAARRGQTGSEREKTDAELFKISHEFSRRDAYKQQFGKDFVPPKRTESTGRETFDVSGIRDILEEGNAPEDLRPGYGFTGRNNPLYEKPKYGKLLADYEKNRSKRGFGSRGDVTPEQQDRINTSRKRGSDIASGRAQVLVDNLKNLSDEDKDYIRENGIVAYLLQDGNGPLTSEWGGENLWSDRIGDLLPEGDWATDSKLQADAEDIFASYEEGFYGQIDKEFADLVNPADLETEKSRWDSLSADEQDSILEQGRDSARGLASRGDGLWGDPRRSIEPDDEELSDEYIEQWLTDKVKFDTDITFDQLEKYNSRTGSQLSDAQLEDLHNRYLSDDKTISDEAGDEILSKFFRQLEEDYYDDMVEDTIPEPDYEDYMRSRDGFASRGGETGKRWSSYDELTDNEKADIEQAYFRKNPGSERPGSRDYDPQIAQDDFEANPEKYGFASKSNDNELGRWWSSYDELSDTEKSDIEQAYFKANPGSERPGSRDYDPQIAQDDFEANPEKYGYAKDFEKQAIEALKANGASEDDARNVAEYWMNNDALHDEYLKEADGDSLYAMALAYDNYIEAAADSYNERQIGFGSGYEPSGGSRSFDPAYFDGDRYENDEYYQMYDEELLQQVTDEPLEDLIDLNNRKIERIADGPFTEEELTKLYEDGDFETIADGLRDKYIYRYGDNIDDTVRERYDTRGLGSRGDETPEMREFDDLTDAEKREVAKNLENVVNVPDDASDPDKVDSYAFRKFQKEHGDSESTVDDYRDFIKEAARKGDWETLDEYDQDLSSRLRENPEVHPDFADYGDAGDMGFASRGKIKDGVLNGKNVPDSAATTIANLVYDRYNPRRDEDSRTPGIFNRYSQFLIENWNGLSKDEKRNVLESTEFGEVEKITNDEFLQILEAAWDEHSFKNEKFAALDDQLRYMMEADNGFASRGVDRRSPMDAREQEMFKNNAPFIDILNEVLSKDKSWDEWVDNEFRDADGTDEEKYESVYGPTTEQELIDFAKLSDESRSDASDQEYFESIYETASPIDKLQYVAETYQPLGARYGSVEHQDRFIQELTERGYTPRRGFASRGDNATRTVQDFERLGSKYSASTIRDSEPFERVEILKDAKAELTAAIDEAEKMLDGLDEDSPEWERLFNAQQDMEFSLGDIEDEIEEMVSEKGRLEDAMSEAAGMVSDAEELRRTRQNIDTPSAEDLQEMSFEDANYEYINLIDDIEEFINVNNPAVDWNSDKQAEIQKALRDGDYDKANDMLYDITQELYDAADDKYRDAEVEHDEYPFVKDIEGFASRGGSRFDTIETPESSAIEAVHYDRNTGELHVAFKPGQTGGEARYYTYSGVPADYFDNEVRGSNSIGRVINDVKKNYDVEVTDPRTIDAINGRGDMTPSAGGRSSAIQDIDVSRSAALSESYYDPNTRELVVTFKGKDGSRGGSYIYEDVTPAEARELASSNSKGKVINKLKASKSVRRASATDRMDREPGAGEDVGSGSFEAQVDSHWDKIGPEEQRRYFARAVDSAINAGTGTSAEEITADAKARAFDDRQIAMMEMQAESLGMGYRNVDVGSSAALNRVQYDPEKRELRVEYRGRDGKGTGEFYVYENVPQSVVDDIEASDSRGSTLRRVRDDFDFRKEEAIPESAFYSMGDQRDGFASGGRLGPPPDDAEYGRELAAQRARDRAAGRNATNPIGNMDRDGEPMDYSVEDGFASRASINESSTGQRIVPSRMHSDDREALAEITDPEERKQRIDELIEFYGPRIFAKPSTQRSKRSRVPMMPDVEGMDEADASDALDRTNDELFDFVNEREKLAREVLGESEYLRQFSGAVPYIEELSKNHDGGVEERSAALEQAIYQAASFAQDVNDITPDGFASRGGKSKLDRGYPYSIDVEKPLEEENSLSAQLTRVNRYQNLDVPEFEPTPYVTPWKSLSESRKERYGNSILERNRQYFDKMRQDGASLREIDDEIGKIHDEQAKAELFSLEQVLKMAKEDFYENARMRLEKANPSMSQNEIDDMLVDMGLSETDFDNLFAKNMDAFELASVAADLEKKRRDIVKIGATPKTGGDRPKVDPLSILGGYSDGDVFGLNPRGFASRGASGSKKKSKEEVYAEMTKQLIDALSESEKLGKWQLPWRRTGMPENGTTGHKYSGSNWFFLTAMADVKGYKSNKWATYDQWQGIGGQVRKGEKATSIFVPIFLKGREKADGTEEKGRIAFISRPVFNLDQIDGLPEDFDKKEILPESERVADLEKTISEIPAVIRNGGDEAYFSPSEDIIQLPPFENFKDARSYYSTVAHELMHWTGGKDRLGRENMNRFGTPEYAYEELVAEIASAMFMAAHNIEPNIQENHGPYLASWIKKLKDDPTALERAMKDAQSAVNYVLDISPNAKSKFSSGEKAEFANPDIAVPTEPVVVVEGLASRGDWPTPRGYEPSEFDMRTALSQIGRGNLMAISGTRAKKRNNEMVLPVNRNQQVIVGYDGGSDTYFVRAEQIITNGKDKGKTRVLGQWDNVYADELGETAYQASLKPSMLSDDNKTVWAQAFDHPQTGSLLDENGQVYEGGFASGGDSMDPDELDAMDWAYDAAQDYLMEQEDMMPEEPSPEDGFASRMNLSRPEKNEIISIARGMNTPFTRSVVEQYDRNGELSDRQWDALNRMTLRGNRRGLASRGDKKPKAPKVPWSEGDRQRFADGDRLRSKKRPGKRREGPSASEYGFGSRGGRRIDMLPSDVFIGDDGGGRSWGFEPIINRVARKFDGKENMTDTQLASELGISVEAAAKMRKQGARTRDIYLLDSLRIQAGGDRDMWGVGNDPLSYYDESGNAIDIEADIPDTGDLAPDVPGTRSAKATSAREYLDARDVLDEVGIAEDASQYSIIKNNSDVFSSRTWQRILARGITREEADTLLKARNSQLTASDIYGAATTTSAPSRRTDSLPLADIFSNGAFDSMRGRRGFPQQVVDSIAEITGRRPSISTVKNFINNPRSSGRAAGRTPFSLSPAQLQQLLDKLGISSDEFDNFRSE